MSEEILQKKLVELIEKEQFYEAIENKQNLDELIKNSKRKNLIPTFPLDLLLERRYLEAAMKVVEALVSYELVSGKIIKNISLDKKERLYPDCILYNKESEQIILIENKTSGQTEREAITELTGYSQEIFNHLPFLSNEELNYIVISTDFNTLLNHSVSSMILNNQNVLCLKPYLDKNEGLKFKIQKPMLNFDLEIRGEKIFHKASLRKITEIHKEKNLQIVAKINTRVFLPFGKIKMGFCWASTLNQHPKTSLQ